MTKAALAQQANAEAPGEDADFQRGWEAYMKEHPQEEENEDTDAEVGRASGDTQEEAGPTCHGTPPDAGHGKPREQASPDTPSGADPAKSKNKQALTPPQKQARAKPTNKKALTLLQMQGPQNSQAFPCSLPTMKQN